MASLFKSQGNSERQMASLLNPREILSDRWLHFENPGKF
jgi:hypothetical protein